MTHYLDTSALVPERSGSLRVKAWLRANDDADLAISRWGAAELQSALSIKVRNSHLTLEQRADVLGVWQAMQTGLALIAVTDRDFDEAAAIAGRHVLRMLAGDALHLAVAAPTGRSLVTLDLAMAAAPVTAF